MRVKIVGCGDAFGSGGRFNTCFHLSWGNHSVLLDCGASSLIAMKRCGVEPDSVEAIFITHLHGDHFGGLVFLLREATLKGTRTRPLAIVGPPSIESRVTKALEAFFPGGSTARRTFELTYEELTPDHPSSVAGVRARAFAAEHESGAPSFSLRLETSAASIAYTGDTLWTDDLIELSRNVDLLICEAYTWSKRRGKHLTYEELIRHLPLMSAKRVMLTHLSEEMLVRMGEITLPVARDGLEFDL